jgi:hypothetical protein
MFLYLYKMEIVTLKIKNAQTKRLIEDLAALNLVEVIKEFPTKNKREKLSEMLTGIINTEQAALMNRELLQMRNEWNRNI